MKLKPIVCGLLAGVLLAGCAPAENAAATAETAAPAPTAAPQELTVYYTAGAESPASTALRAYAADQGVMLTELGPDADPAAADLAVLDAPPAGEGWQNLAADPLLATAAARAGLEGEVTALPVGRSLYAYWADSATLTALFGADPTDDLRAASWAEWSDAAETLTAWLAEPSAETVTLNGQDYTLPESRPAGTEALTGVFALPEQGRAAFGMPLFTGALLAAGDTRTEDTLTGPLNGVYSALTLELQNRGGDGAAALAEGSALFCRASLGELTAAGAAQDTLVWLPVKADFVESDLSTEEYNLTGLLNYPVLATAGWLAVPASADEAGTRAAAAAILWLYTSADGEAALTEDAALVTPWNKPPSPPCRFPRWATVFCPNPAPSLTRTPRLRWPPPAQPWPPMPKARRAQALPRQTAKPGVTPSPKRWQHPPKKPARNDGFGNNLAKPPNIPPCTPVFFV